MKGLTTKEAALRKNAWDLVHRLEAVKSKDADIVRGVLDKVAEYHRRIDEMENEGKKS